MNVVCWWSGIPFLHLICNPTSVFKNQGPNNANVCGLYVLSLSTYVSGKCPDSVFFLFFFLKLHVAHLYLPVLLGLKLLTMTKLPLSAKICISNHSSKNEHSILIVFDDC